MLVYLPVLTFADGATQGHYKGDDIDEEQLFLLAVIVMPFLEEVIFRYFLRYNRINPILISERRWNAIFPLLVYSSALVFSLIHLSNYEFDFNPDIWFVYPLLVFSQFIGGLVLSFIRVRLNFYFGVAFHMAWNLTFLLLSIVLPDQI